MTWACVIAALSVCFLRRNTAQYTSKNVLETRQVSNCSGFRGTSKRLPPAIRRTQPTPSLLHFMRLVLACCIIILCLMYRRIGANPVETSNAKNSSHLSTSRSQAVLELLREMPTATVAPDVLTHHSAVSALLRGQKHQEAAKLLSSVKCFALRGG